MIQRHVLTNPEYITEGRFDHFNDYADTRLYLSHMKAKGHPDAERVAELLREAYVVWNKQFWEKFKKV